ncbi:hypothetical protein F5887DRAFT_1292217 [Amanita rubescens]|nr:hypothetical protein F5887DRAFT_1292217 [Amanita rubescens]
MSQNNSGVQVGNQLQISPSGSKPKERRGLSNLELVELGLHLSDEDILRDEIWICWKSRILNLLDIADLSGYPLGQIPQPDKDREPDEYEIWDARDQEAFYILFRNISHRQLLQTPVSYTQDMTSAELWNSLRQINENHSWLAVGLKMRKFYSARAGEGSDIKSYCSKLLQNLVFDIFTGHTAITEYGVSVNAVVILRTSNSPTMNISA